MKIATFNINGIKARLETLTDWLDTAQPDVVLCQEIKSIDDAFPRAPFEDRGYNVETHGQKSFNGVAILSKLPLEDVTRGLPMLETKETDADHTDDQPNGQPNDQPDDQPDDQARWIEATVMGNHTAVRLCCLYLPNGNPTPGPKYDYKLAWMDRLHARARALMADEMPALMGGDYNVIPQAEDAANPQAWTEDALYLPQTRASFRRILNLGFTEAFRARTQGPGHYAFWDYQAGAWQRNNGIRIDHFLLTPHCADLMTDCWIEKDVRAGTKPSDHVPVWIELDA